MQSHVRSTPHTGGRSQYSRRELYSPKPHSVDSGPTAIHFLVPGQPAELVIWQHDQYGNKVTARAEPGLFLACATGPGAMQSDVIPQDSGKVIIK